MATLLLVFVLTAVFLIVRFAIKISSPSYIGKAGESRIASILSNFEHDGIVFNDVIIQGKYCCDIQSGIQCGGNGQRKHRLCLFLRQTGIYRTGQRTVLQAGKKHSQSETSFCMDKGTAAFPCRPPAYRGNGKNLHT